MTAPATIHSGMSQGEVVAWVAGLLHEMFEIDPALITPSAHLYNDLDIDSIDAVDIVVRLNQITGKRIQPEIFRNVRTVQDVVDVLFTLLAENPK